MHLLFFRFKIFKAFFILTNHGWDGTGWTVGLFVDRGRKRDLLVEAANRGDNIFGPGTWFRIFAGSGKLGSNRSDVRAEISFKLAECLAFGKAWEGNVVLSEAMFPGIVEIIPDPGDFCFNKSAALSAILLRNNKIDASDF